MDLLRIAQQIRQLRESQGLTVSQLAEKSSLSKAFISRLENFRVNPSINALSRITAALGISMSDFFNENAKAPAFVFGRFDQGEPICRDNCEKYGINYFSLAYKKLNRVMDPFLIEYRPATELRELLMHPDDEFFILLDGSIDFYIGDTQNVTRMNAGDTVYLERNLPHTAKLADGCELARALLVYCRPAEKQDATEPDAEQP